MSRSKEEALRSVELFDDLPDERIEELAALACEQTASAGEIFVDQGQVPQLLSVLVEGRIEWSVELNGERVVLAMRDAPTYFGAMNLLLDQPIEARGQAVAPSRLVSLDGAAFRDLLREEPSVKRRTLALVGPVLRNAEAQLRQRERLASLGTLAAGLAHELNNPAAAAQRSAAELARAIEILASTISRFVSSGVERAEAEQLVALQQEALAGVGSAPVTDRLALADREDELARSLDAQGQEGWRLAPVLAEAGLDEGWIDRVAALAGPATGAALDWVTASLSARGLAAEVEASAERISKIVSAVKDYTYMDRGELQDVDVNAGLESTLTILKHKVKQGDVTIVREYDPKLPRVPAAGSELNQVWTNLLDNALDAVDGKGTITIRTGAVGDERVVVEIEDDGPGIPADAQSRVFEPFYTTKPAGSGTGLGLDISRRIVIGHRGSIVLTAAPGRTRFTVSLPTASTT